MGNCSCLEKPRVTACDNDDWGLPAERPADARSTAAENGGMKVKIRMTKGQLRRLLESAGHGGPQDEDVVAEIMSMGTVRVEVVSAAYRQAERHHRPAKLETIQDVDE